MKPSTRRLILILARFHRRADAAHERWMEAADRDAAFDSGEWSGPACERAFEQEADAIARRLGFASAELALDIAHALGVSDGSNPQLLHEGRIDYFEGAESR